MESDVAMALVPSVVKHYRQHFSLPVSYLVLLCAYTVALSLGWVLVNSMTFIDDTALKFFVVDLVCTCAIFFFSFLFNNSSIYDPYTSVSNLAIAWYWYTLEGDRGDLHKLLAMIGISTFCVKELVCYFKDWKGLDFEDARFVAGRESAGEKVWMYWLQSFGVYHILTTAVFFNAMIPLYYLISTDYYTTLGVVIAGFAVVCIGIAFDPAAFWFGLYIMLLGVNTDLWWTVISPLAMFAYMFMMYAKYMEIRFGNDQWRLSPEVRIMD